VNSHDDAEYRLTLATGYWAKAENNATDGVKALARVGEVPAAIRNRIDSKMTGPPASRPDGPDATGE
jgi:hypothetical protein